MSERTPGPWEVDELKSGNLFIQGDGRNYTVAQIVRNVYIGGEVHKADAAFIARACNAHDQPLEALKDLAYQVDRLKGEESQVLDTDHARAAIEAAS